MLTTYEDEIADLKNQIEFLLNNADELKGDDKKKIRHMAIDFMIDLHQYLKQNDYDAYEKLIDHAAKCNEL